MRPTLNERELVDNQSARNRQVSPSPNLLGLQLPGLMARPVFWVISLLIIGFALIAIWVTSSNQPKGSSANKNTPVPVMTVSVDTAAVRPVHQEIKVTGSIWAWDPLSIGAEVNGAKIELVQVEEGDSVKKGQVLATLNSSVLRAELERERAQLALALASLDKAIQPNRQEDINALRAAEAQARASVSQHKAGQVQAQANLANAKSNAKRYTDLVSQGAVSRQESESRDTAAQVAEAEVVSAREQVRAAEFAWKQTQERLSMAVAGGRREDVRIAQAEVARWKANIQRLEALIAQTIVRAPSNGLITKRDAHIGDTSSVGKPLFHMVRDGRLELRAQVPEKDLVRLHPGDKTLISCSGTGIERKAGQIREISPQVDPESRLGLVRIDLPANCGLKPGMFAEGHVALAQYPALTVPSQAVVSRDGRYTVLVLRDANRVESRVVDVGARSGDIVEIKGGIQPNDTVVTSGAGFLKDGDHVTVGR